MGAIYDAESFIDNATEESQALSPSTTALWLSASLSGGGRKRERREENPSQNSDRGGTMVMRHRNFPIRESFKTQHSTFPGHQSQHCIGKELMLRLRRVRDLPSVPQRVDDRPDTPSSLLTTAGLSLPGHLLWLP